MCKNKDMVLNVSQSNLKTTTNQIEFPIQNNVVLFFFFLWNVKHTFFTYLCIHSLLSCFITISASFLLPHSCPVVLVPCLHCLFTLFNLQTNVLWHAPIAHRHRCCQQPQKATFSLALLPIPACSHSNSLRKHCICHKLWLMALLIAVFGHHHTYTFCF